MEQVPKNYGIVGDGRMATHFMHYLNSLGEITAQWSRASYSKDGISLCDTLKNSDVILLLISDDAIENFVKENDWLLEKEVVHFSGALVVPKIQSMHPLMTFSNSLYDLGFYKKISFIYEKDKVSFNEVFPALKNSSVAINPDKKALYHSLCVMGGNFTVLLWQKVMDELSQLGIEEELIFPYLEKITENIKQDCDKALTGPLDRKDKRTIVKNLGSLKDDPYSDIYQSFLRSYDQQLYQDVNSEINEKDYGDRICK